MKNLNDITAVIVTYKTSEKIIFDCLKSLDPKVKIIIIENSTNFIHEKNVLSNFPNTKIVCTGDNLGYGKGNNFGFKKINTKFLKFIFFHIFTVEFSNTKPLSRHMINIHNKKY